MTCRCFRRFRKLQTALAARVLAKMGAANNWMDTHWFTPNLQHGYSLRHSPGYALIHAKGAPSAPASTRTGAKSGAIFTVLGEICGLICFDLSTPFKEILLVLFSGMIKLVVGPVDMWARGARVWAGGGQRASVVHGLSTRPEGRAPVRKDSSTYPPGSRTCRRAHSHQERRHGDERVGSGQGRADCNGGSC